MIHVAGLWRHPIKSHGREELDEVTLVTGQTMPWDRHWAVTHEKSKFDPSAPEWVMCRNFMIGSMNPKLAGIWAKYDEASGTMTLRHADLDELTFSPTDPADVERFLAWARPLCPADNPQHASLVAVKDRGMTDTPDPTISIMTHASHKAVAGRLGRPLELERWRGNIWLDGTAPWEEFEWIDRDLRIGDAELHVSARVVRCKHTMSNPRTGLRDTDTLAVLREGWDHQDFGIYAIVTKGGKIAMNDKVEVI